MTTQKYELTFRQLYARDVRMVNAIATSAAFDYSLIEEKLINFISTLVPSPQKGNNGEIQYPLIYVIYYSHFCKCMGIKGDNKYYNRIDEALQHLRDKSIKLKMNDQKSTLISFLERVEFNKENKKGESRKAVIKLDDRIIPILIEKRKNFFAHHPEYIMFMDSKYSIRLYQWLYALHNREIGILLKKTKFKCVITNKDGEQEDISIPLNTHEEDMIYISRNKENKTLWQGFIEKKKKYKYSEREIIIDFDDIKENLSIPPAYRGYETVNKRIIEPVINEINEKTDFYIKKEDYYIDNNNKIHFFTTFKTTAELVMIDLTLEKLIENIKISQNEISHVMENEEEYEVEQYKLIEEWADSV